MDGNELIRLLGSDGDEVLFLPDLVGCVPITTTLRTGVKEHLFPSLGLQLLVVGNTVACVLFHLRTQRVKAGAFKPFGGTLPCGILRDDAPSAIRVRFDPASVAADWEHAGELRLTFELPNSDVLATFEPSEGGSVLRSVGACLRMHECDEIAAFL